MTRQISVYSLIISQTRRREGNRFLFKYYVIILYTSTIVFFNSSESISCKTARDHAIQLHHASVVLLLRVFVSYDCFAKKIIGRYVII